VDHWDYFYAPVVCGDYEGGVLIAVRQMSEVFGGEYQVYGWNQIKKESNLGPRIVTLSGQTSVSSSAASSDRISEDSTAGNTSAESSQLDFSENAPSVDADYLDAVERGDTETAQRMVDEAAEANGYTRRLYHGTSGNRK